MAETSAAATQQERWFDSSKLGRQEYVGMGAALVLLASLWLPWFSTSDSNPNSQIGGERGDFSAWEVYGTLDVLLVLACSAPFILAYIIARGHSLTWRPGEVTMIAGMTALVLILCNGIILGKPGDTVEVSFGIGYLVGLLGAIGICAAGLVRQAEGGRTRKPPGSVS